MELASNATHCWSMVGKNGFVCLGPKHSVIVVLDSTERTSGKHRGAENYIVHCSWSPAPSVVTADVSSSEPEDRARDKSPKAAALLPVGPAPCARGLGMAGACTATDSGYIDGAASGVHADR